MQKFHSIATDRYIPLSFDNAYLFNQYDRISNFLVFNLDKKYRNFLAKPVKNNYDIDWYSVHMELQPVEQSPYREYGLKQYWLVMEELQKRIEDLMRNKDSNVQYWGAILQAVFNPEDNLIFTNGQDICIIWGWKFENSHNRKPQLLGDSFQETMNTQDTPLPPQIPDLDHSIADIVAPKKPERLESPPAIEVPTSSPDIPEEYFMADVKEKNIAVETAKKESFLAFLKYIAVTYWWVLIVLLVLICFVFFFKSLIHRS
ncbi:MULTISPECIES: hypothetical protein [Sphingobacterium]|uniref:hypothetical protein n=1 Tax=Sphingobacterium TaxID=28453 RepID=UPI00257A15D9|nr:MULTISPECIES: hypothetical protein [Sphingobacterium]